MPPLDITDERLTREDTGYHKGLHSRQLQMIALGGAIGTGLFLGAGGRLASAGPGLFLVYGICGIFVFLILRALGELVLHRPSSGSFVSYAREFYGEKVAFVAGWMYFLNWAMTGIVDTTAIAHYCHYWRAFQPIPQWTLALIALLVVLSMNLISVRLFGELEFLGLIDQGDRAGYVSDRRYGLSRWALQDRRPGDRGLPVEQPWRHRANRSAAHSAGHLGGGIRLRRNRTGGHRGRGNSRTGKDHAARDQLCGVAHRVLLRRVDCPAGPAAALYRLQRTCQPVRDLLSKIGIDAAGSVMNLVVLTAALSSLNAGLYSTGRILRSMAINGSGPRFTAPMSKTGVPYGGILLTAGIGLLGIILNAIKPSQAFEIVLHIAATGVIAAWATIVACQLRLHRMANAGQLQRPKFRMPLSPFSGYLTLAFLAGVLILMYFDEQHGPWMIAATVIGVPALIGGWYLVRNRVTAVAHHAIDHTKSVAVVHSADPI